jgi:hypothetical protein
MDREQFRAAAHAAIDDSQYHPTEEEYPSMHNWPFSIDAHHFILNCSDSVCYKQ